MKVRLKSVKRAVSFILALTMVVTMLPQAGFSSYADDVSGTESYEEVVAETVETETEEEYTEPVEEASEEIYLSDVSENDVSGDEGEDVFSASVSSKIKFDLDENILGVDVSGNYTITKNELAIEKTYTDEKDFLSDEITLILKYSDGFTPVSENLTAEGYEGDLLDKSTSTFYAKNYYTGAPEKSYKELTIPVSELANAAEWKLKVTSKADYSSKYYNSLRLSEVEIGCLNGDFELYLDGECISDDTTLYFDSEKSESETLYFKVETYEGISSELRQDCFRVFAQKYYFDVSENCEKTVDLEFDKNSENVKFDGTKGAYVTLDYTRDDKEIVYGYYIKMRTVKGFGGSNTLFVNDYTKNIDVNVKIYEWSKTQDNKDVLTIVADREIRGIHFDAEKVYVASIEVTRNSQYYDCVVDLRYNYNIPVELNKETINGKEYYLIYNADGKSDTTYRSFELDITEKIKASVQKTLVISDTAAEYNVYCDNNKLAYDVSGSDKVYNILTGKKVTVEAISSNKIAVTSLKINGTTVKDKNITKSGNSWFTSFEVKNDTKFEICSKAKYGEGKVNYHKTYSINKTNGVYVLKESMTDGYIYIIPEYYGSVADSMAPRWSKAVLEYNKKKYTIEAKHSAEPLAELFTCGTADFAFYFRLENPSKLAGKSFSITLYGDLNGTEEKICTYNFSVPAKLTSVKVAGVKNAKLTQTAGTEKAYKLSFNKGADKDALRVETNSDDIRVKLSDDKNSLIITSVNLKVTTAEVSIYSGENKLTSFKVTTSTKAYSSVQATYKISETSDTYVSASIGVKNDIKTVDSVRKYFVIQVTCDKKDECERIPDGTYQSGMIVWESIDDGKKSRCTLTIPEKNLKENNYKLDKVGLNKAIPGEGKACKYDIKLWVLFKDAESGLTGKETKGSFNLKNPYFAPSVKATGLYTKKACYPFIEDVKIATISYDKKTSFYGYKAVDKTYPYDGGLDLDNSDNFALIAKADGGTFPGVHVVEITPVCPDGCYAKPVTIKVNVAYPIALIRGINSTDYVYKEIGKAVSFSATAGQLYSVVGDTPSEKITSKKIRWTVEGEGDLEGKVTVSSKGVVTIAKDYVPTASGEKITLIAWANDFKNSPIKCKKEIVVSSEPRKYINVGLYTTTENYMDGCKYSTAEGFTDGAKVYASELNYKSLLMLYDYDGSSSRYYVQNTSDFKYTSTDKKYTSINKNGLITVKKSPAKDTKITFKATEIAGKKRTFAVTVTLKPDKKVSLDGAYLDYSTIGDTLRLSNTNKASYDSTTKLSLAGNNEGIGFYICDQNGDEIKSGFKISVKGAKISNNIIDNMKSIIVLSGKTDIPSNMYAVSPTAKKFSITVQAGKEKKTYNFENVNYIDGKITADKEVKTLYTLSKNPSFTFKFDEKYAGKDVCLYMDALDTYSSTAKLLNTVIYSQDRMTSKHKEYYYASSIKISKVDEKGYVSVGYSGIADMQEELEAIALIYNFKTSNTAKLNAVVIEDTKDGTIKPISAPISFTVQTVKSEGKTGKNDFQPVTEYTLTADVSGNGSVQMVKKKGTSCKSEVEYTGLKAVNVGGKYTDIDGVVSVDKTGKIAINYNRSAAELISKYGTSLKIQVFYTVTPKGCLPINASSTITIKLKK